jgi:hypothetical protein
MPGDFTHSLVDIARELKRPVIYLRGLQTRFELPEFVGYSDAYLEFLTKLVHLRALSISEETVRNLWHIEKKLLLLLHADTNGSPTWFLDACGATTHPEQRLLLSNFDIGVEIPSKTLQLGLNFSDKLPELFTGRQMGEDGLRLLHDYLQLCTRIRSDIQAELPILRAAIRRGRQL